MEAIPSVVPDVSELVSEYYDSTQRFYDVRRQRLRIAVTRIGSSAKGRKIDQH